MSRRLPALVLMLTAIAAVLIVARSTPTPTTATFARITAGWMPVAPSTSGLTDTWFCPGVPATGEDGVGGQVLIANRGDELVTAQIEWLAAAGVDPATDPGISSETVTVGPRDVVALQVDARRRGAFVGAVVEVEGAGAIVEQRAVHPAGTAVAPCANSTSAQWYLAEGFTLGGSPNRVLLTNPFDDVVIADVRFATADGSRIPAAYQGIPVAPRSITVLDLGAPGAGAQNEELLAVTVEATRGQLVVARSQHFLAGGRSGYTLSLGAPALRDQWWFADGEKGPGVSERFSIYNPTATEVEVDTIFLGISALAEVEPIRIPARQVVAFDPGQVATLVEGRHATVFSTLSEQSIVVERVLTRTSDGRPQSSVLLGAPPAPNGFVATEWFLVAGPGSPASEAIVLYNVDNVEGVVSVVSIGPDGPVPVPGLEGRVLPAASILTLDLVDADVVGRPLVITSTTRIVVERSLPSGSGRSASWALPVR